MTRLVAHGEYAADKLPVAVIAPATSAHSALTSGPIRDFFRAMPCRMSCRSPRMLVRTAPAKATPTAKIASISPLMPPPNPFGLFFHAFKQDHT